MTHRIAAKGYTSVVLVLNMKRFVAGAKARKRFETVRGSPEFAEALQDAWPDSLPQSAVITSYSIHYTKLYEQIHGKTSS